jgi:hypothetical protein
LKRSKEDTNGRSIVSHKATAATYPSVDDAKPPSYVQDKSDSEADIFFDAQEYEVISVSSDSAVDQDENEDDNEDEAKVNFNVVDEVPIDLDRDVGEQLGTGALSALAVPVRAPVAVKSEQSKLRLSLGASPRHKLQRPPSRQKSPNHHQ